MDLGGFPTRYDHWGRAPATLVLIILATVLMAAAWPTATTPQQKVRASETEQSDLDFYRATISRVAAGEPYYATAADELRKGGYPLQPSFTFRLPTLTMVYAVVPMPLMIAVEALLALLVLLVWWRRLEPVLSLRLLVVAMLLLVGGTAALVEPVPGMFHESWAALLMALMVGLRRPGHAAGAMMVGAIALAVRESVLPMILVMACLALFERRFREMLGWTALVAIFAVAMFAHIQMIATVVRPDDLASPGWSGMLGPRFAVSAVSAVSSATALPASLAALAIMLSLFGWLSVACPWALRASALLLGYGTMLAMFARADTFYWALLVAPLSLLGLIFVPRALSTLVRAARGVAQPAI